MGIFSRIRGLFCCCIRSSTSSSLNNEETSRLLGPNVDSSQSNSSRHIRSTADVNCGLVSNDSNSNRGISHHQRNSSRHFASTPKAGLNYGTIKKIDVHSTSNRVRASVNKSKTVTTGRQSKIKPSYFLQTFITSPIKSLPKGKPAFTLESIVVCLNEWTACTAIILDGSSQRLGPQHTVDLYSDSCVEFRDCRVYNGGLQFSMKACNAEIITVFFNIKKYPDTNSFTLTEKILVRCDPCSSVQAEMTVKRIDESNGFIICVFQLSIGDVLGGITSHGSCELDILSSGENEVIQKKRMHLETGQIYFEITVRGQQPWSTDLVLTFNGQIVPHAKKIEVFDNLRGLCCRALKDGDYESIPDFIEFYGSHIFIPLSVGDDDGKFLPYNEDNCEVLHGSSRLLCKNIKRNELLGSGFAHINNIARVLKLRNPLDVNEIQAEDIVTIDLSNVRSKRRHVCKEVVQHLLRGLYYRRKAAEADAVRVEWKNRIAILGKLLGTSPSVRVCKIFRDHFSHLMNRYNREACDELFTFFNFRRDVSKVDLHGLYVADEKKLELLRVDLSQGLANDKDLLRRVQRSKKVDEIIQKFRSDGDEAIRKLDETLESFDLEKAIKNNTPWLEIVVGAGHHSRIKNKQSIRPKVEKRLKERNLKFAPVNKGSLVVTFLTYSGPEPCFGEYYCEKCDYRWKNSQSYVDEYQKCVQCQGSCWPIKQREEEKVENYYHL